MFATSATGGAGSYPKDTIGTLLYGINRAIDGAASVYVAREVAKTRAQYGEGYTEDADGNWQLSGAPEAKSIRAAFSNPYVIGGAMLAVGALVFLIARK